MANEIKIGRYRLSMKFLLLLAIAVFIIYLRMQVQIETVGPADTLAALGLR